jgi:hypothetical protein
VNGETTDQTNCPPGEPHGRPRVKFCSVAELLDAGGVAVRS